MLVRVRAAETLGNSAAPHWPSMQATGHSVSHLGLYRYLHRAERMQGESALPQRYLCSRKAEPLSSFSQWQPRIGLMTHQPPQRRSTAKASRDIRDSPLQSSLYMAPHLAAAAQASPLPFITVLPTPLRLILSQPAVASLLDYRTVASRPFCSSFFLRSPPFHPTPVPST
jgi:hypothetical protein